ncbi:rho GTPase-activating protein 21 [Caerostris extrusa]|uniref:Rho GTPase-activating protein 21 n=1 Tax=Caerostris extrusa TaxID=172846 RepID=A0AAV4TJL8_CAEEX|nr:rho GTPase-activating protein 21 [Caerostris extrusa]
MTLCTVIIWLSQKSVSEALHGAGETILSHSVPCSYSCVRPQYGGDNHSCDRVQDSTCLCISSNSKSSFYSNNKLASTEDVNLHFTAGQDMNSSSTMYLRAGERNSVASDYDFSENSSIPSINIVAQRRHQFESGNLLAESMERMHLYKSELSRMSKPNHVRLVSSRTAEFETKTSPSTNSTLGQKSSEIFKKKEEASENHSKYIDNAIQSICYDDYDTTLDHQNSNKTPTDDSITLLADSSESKNTVQNEFAPTVAGVVHRRKTVPGIKILFISVCKCLLIKMNVILFGGISYLRATANERMNVESDLSEEDETSDASSPNKEFRIQKLKSFFGEKTPKVKQALVPVDVADANGCSNEEPAEETKNLLWMGYLQSSILRRKKRREPSKGTITGDEHVINITNSIAKAADDYVKRKHVLRLMLLNGTEYLVQTESHTSMMEWLKALQVFTKEISQLPEWLKNTSVLEKAAAYEQQISKGKSGQHHHMRKLVFRHRSPSEHSPSVKTRRASQGDELALTKLSTMA